jgi:hypothetical protein
MTRSTYQKHYYARPEVKERQREYYREYSKRPEVKARCYRSYFNMKEHYVDRLELITRQIFSLKAKLRESAYHKHTFEPLYDKRAMIIFNLETEQIGIGNILQGFQVIDRHLEDLKLKGSLKAKTKRVLVERLLKQEGQDMVFE